MRTQNDLNRMLSTAVNQCATVGIKTGHIDRIIINTRAATRWGLCKRHNGHNIIEISSRLMQDDVTNFAVMNVIVHEVLHTCPDCSGHTGMWKIYADRMNRNYGYHITRRTSPHELGIESSMRDSHVKYVITCSCCGKENKYIKESKAVRRIREYGDRSGYACGVCGSKKLVYKEAK